MQLFPEVAVGGSSPAREEPLHHRPDHWLAAEVAVEVAEAVSRIPVSGRDRRLGRGRRVVVDCLLVIGQPYVREKR